MNYHELILEGLREWSGIICDRERQAKVDMLYRFIALMGDETFNRRFEERFMGDLEFDDVKKENHKKMNNLQINEIDEQINNKQILLKNL